MTAPQHRTYRPDPDAVSVRAPEADEDATFVVRMPVTSTGEARDGEAFTRDRVEGFRDQIRGGTVPVFLDHGRNEQTGSRYSAVGKVGYLANPDVTERDGATELDADFVLVDPDTVADGADTLREALATVRTQAEAGVPLASSVGWNEDTGERDVPGDAELLETSIVGIPSDPRTTQSAEPAALARAVSAASSDFDVAAFVRELRGERPFGPPGGDGDEFDDFEDCVESILNDNPDMTQEQAEALCGSWEQDETESHNVVEVGGEEVDLTPPDAVQNAAVTALAKDDELEPDCGTGAGRQSAQQIAADDVSADTDDGSNTNDIADIAAYLTSHEEDVTADGPPTDWSDEEWQDCGNLQYALWGGTGTGTGLEWAQSTANDVAEAQGEELPYPERAGRNLDDPEFSEGDAVEWTSNDVTVRGRVADIGDEFSPAEGVTITGDEGEAVYLIHELDDSLEPPQYRRENVAKPESSLDESQADLPPLEGNFADEENDMSDTDTESAGEESGDPDREESDGMDAGEFRQSMLEMQQEQTEILREMREDGMGGDGDDEDDDDEGEDSADADDADRTVTLDGDEQSVDEAIATLRDEYDAADAGDLDAETQDRAEDDDGESDDTDGFGMTGAMED
jgi:hypothetical protein